MTISITDYYNVAELFEQQVLVTPENIAVIDENRRLTYKQLNQQSNQVAHLLRQQGVSRNDFIALLLDPGVEFIIFVLAIIKAGAVYLPLDILLPSKKLKDILDASTVRLLITNRKYRSSLETVSCQIESIDQLLEKSNHLSTANPLSIRSSVDPIYMLYTSGSTGKPKGIIIPHQAVINLVKTVNYFSVGHSDTVAQINNLAFDASVLEIWSALLNGSTLFFVSLEARKNYFQLKEQLLEYHVTHLMLPTGYFHHLVLFSPDTLDGIDLLVFGGEAVNPHIIRNFLNIRKERGLPITLINAYGPSEATVAACRFVVDEKYLNDIEQLASIGRPIDNVKIYVLDEKGQHVSLGQVGELCISGINLALRYYKNESPGEEKFIKNPFDQQYPFQKLYKTGDLVKQLSDGNLFYIGRLDYKVKVQGFQVHLGEVEHHLMQHPKISAAAVVAERDSTDRVRLISYIVVRDKKASMTSDEIRKYLAEWLPAYMLPTKYIRLQELPLSTIGKVDKNYLCKMPGTDLSAINIVVPTNSIERKLKTIFCQLLKVDHIDVTKSFFDLGVNSLSLVEVCVKISEEFECSLRPEMLFAYPTIRKLGQYLKRKTTLLLEN